MDPMKTTVSLHRDTRMVSVSGTCPWLHSGKEWKNPEDCHRECCLSGDLLMDAPALSRPLVLRGKTIIERLEDPVPILDLPDTVDRLIFDREGE